MGNFLNVEKKQDFSKCEELFFPNFTTKCFQSNNLWLGGWTTKL